MLSNKLTILVNSSDGFSDCWEPFFRLFALYWPNCDVEILLNTETADWSFPGLNLRCTKVAVGSGKLTWSECLIRALDQVDTPLVLYVQEDYFLERLVDVRLVHELVNKMETDAKIKHIGLTHFGSAGPFKPTSDSRLWRIGPNARYRISTQAGLWRKETLKYYLNPSENGWMFEIFGSIRARKSDECFLTVNRDLYYPEKSPIFLYTHTGIIKGKWHHEIPILFRNHGIEIDFEKRGMHIEPHWVYRKIQTLRRLRFNPLAIIRTLGFW